MFEPLPQQEAASLRRRQLDAAGSHRQRYLDTPADTEPSAGMLMWYEDAISTCDRGSFHLTAGSCAIEAALHPDPELTLEDRHALLDSARARLGRAFKLEATTNNDIAERARWEISQLPTYEAIIGSLHGEAPAPDFLERQEKMFHAYFNHLLSRWPHETLDGVALESLCSYFLHRSNALFPDQQPLYSVQAAYREDHHADEGRRVDVTVFDPVDGLRYGIQVKGGKGSNPYADSPIKHRIFMKHARKLLCLPYTNNALRRTLIAIVNNKTEFRKDLDTIAADHRARIMGYMMLPVLSFADELVTFLVTLPLVACRQKPGVPALVLSRM